MWLEQAGLVPVIADAAAAFKKNGDGNVEPVLDKVIGRCLDAWQEAADLKTYRQAVAEEIAFRISQGESFELNAESWLEFSERASWYEAREKARAMEIEVPWSAELAKTPEGYYQVQGGLEYAVAKSLAAAPFADILWMETATANLHEAKEFADAIHAEFPDKMLAYNLSPSFNWDTTGMTDEQMKRFPEELGKLGFVFNFITYGGHQIDGLAAEDFATALRQDGMLSLARLQRKLRLIESPYRTPQTSGRRPAPGCRADGGFRTHGHHQGHGQGIDAASAPGADRVSAQGAGRVAADLGGAQSICRRRSAPSCVRWRRARTSWS